MSTPTIEERVEAARQVNALLPDWAIKAARFQGGKKLCCGNLTAHHKCGHCGRPLR